MPTSITTTKTTTPAHSRARLLLPLAGAGLVLVCVILLFRGLGESETASSVARRIQELALAGNEADAPAGAGMLGPWKIAAEHIEPTTGRFVNFRIQTMTTMISAREAELHIDPRENAFSFELFDVVHLRLPENEDEQAAGLTRMEHHVLGPIPYNVDIVPDAGTELPPLDALDPSPLVNVDRSSVDPTD